MLVFIPRILCKQRFPERSPLYLSMNLRFAELGKQHNEESECKLQGSFVAQEERGLNQAWTLQLLWNSQDSLNQDFCLARCLKMQWGKRENLERKWHIQRGLHQQKLDSKENNCGMGMEICFGVKDNMDCSLPQIIVILENFWDALNSQTSLFVFF